LQGALERSKSEMGMLMGVYGGVAALSAIGLIPQHAANTHRPQTPAQVDKF
jgi:hypothetical protein